jgi:outer membrane protein
LKQFISRGVAAVIVLSALHAVPVFAQEDAARIGFVNTDRILREAAPAKAAQSKLEQEFSRREKEIADAGLALKNASERFEREGPTLSESQRQARQRQLMDQDREFQRRQREFQEDLNARKQEELQRVIDRANGVIKQVAESEKYDVILQEAVYINPRLDITDKVIKALNANK